MAMPVAVDRFAKFASIAPGCRANELLRLPRHSLSTACKACLQLLFGISADEQNVQEWL
jgi:hypothetical protein